MTKFAVASFISLASAGTFEEGAQLGLALSGVSSTEADGVLSALNAGAPRSAAVDAVVNAANAKASFLAPLNLHIGETPSASLATAHSSFVQDAKFLSDSMGYFANRIDA